ncbi:MAG: DUF397 domain-containing protein [Pseudonocardia sp.]
MCARPASNIGGPVEVAIATDGRVGVRDSKDRTRQPHIFTPTEWAAFLAGALAGEFTPETRHTHNRPGQPPPVTPTGQAP